MVKCSVSNPDLYSMAVLIRIRTSNTQKCSIKFAKCGVLVVNFVRLGNYLHKVQLSGGQYFADSAVIIHVLVFKNQQALTNSLDPDQYWTIALAS